MAGVSAGNKLEKAKQLGVRILSEDEFLSTIREDKPLTLDELQELDGQLVWIENIWGGYAEWAYVSKDSCLCRTISGCKAFF